MFKKNRYFSQNMFKDYIEDDHLPFLKKNVPVVHLIVAPFPKIWHTPNDNFQHLDWESINDLTRIFKRFILNLTLQK